nr:MAG TPA: hypothetical protein [Caudoviricetes sp.]
MSPISWPIRWSRDSTRLVRVMTCASVRLMESARLLP